MLKSLNQYLLVHYPLLWNTRFFNVLLFAIIGHIIFFFIGQISVHSIRDFYDRDDYTELFESAVVGLYSTLVIVLFFIIWLIYYLRNNPFKSFYPVTKTYLIKEFFTILFISLITITFFNSYEYGRHLKKIKITKNFDPIKESHIINQANCFLPIETYNFESAAHCDTIYRDLDVPDYIPNDSCNEDIYSYSHENELTESIPAEEYPAIAPSVERAKFFSYLNYCSISHAIDLDSNIKSDIYTINAQRWLKNKQKDSIEMALVAYQELLNKYEIRFSFNPKTLTNWCFETPQHDVLHDFYSLNYYDVINPTYQNYGEFSYVETVVNEVYDNNKASFLSLFNWELYFYFSLSISIILLMFRITRLKPWLIASIGMGVWAILFAILANFTKDNTLQYVFITAWIILFFMSFYLIKRKSKKILSATFLTWSIYGYLALIPIIFNLIRENTQEVKMCVNRLWKIITPEHPIHSWIINNKDTINMINITSCIIFIVLVIIPLAYKWQSNPNE
jgi:hypothetical protein